MFDWRHRQSAAAAETARRDRESLGDRAQITQFADNDIYFEAPAVGLPDVDGDEAEAEALVRSVNIQFANYVKLNKRVSPEVIVSIGQIDDPSKLADTVASHLNLKISEKQELLEIPEIATRLEAVFRFMEGKRASSRWRRKTTATCWPSVG